MENMLGKDRLNVVIFDSEAAFGYKQLTTLFADFSIAEHFGESAIRGTYLRAFKEYKDQYKYLTELVMVLNWKIWQHYEHNDELAKLYNEIWEVADMYACENLKDEELDYFYKTTD